MFTYDELRKDVVPAKRKRRRLNKLSIEEVKEVLKAVKVDYLTYESVAIKYCVSVSTVGKIVRNFKLKPDYEVMLYKKQSKKEDKVLAAISTIKNFKDNNEEIWTLKQVAEAAKAQH